MNKPLISLCTFAFVAFSVSAFGAAAKHAADTTIVSTQSRISLEPQNSVTEGSVTVEGKKIAYTATAGTIILTNVLGQPTGSIFYAAYVKRGVKDNDRRPITFFYNGGPGSASYYLHMAGFGPERVVTAAKTQTGNAPYKLVNNDYSLLDATDEVFIDAMSTGYSRILGKAQGGVGTPDDFYGTDPDVHAFAQFITKYLSDNNRWNSPKYIYGESYGTTRSELLVNYLELVKGINLNGVILQSGYAPNVRGTDLAYAVGLPAYATNAWYHKTLPNQPSALQPFLNEVEQFAMTRYADALNAGNTLSQSEFEAVAQKLHDYTGLSTAYIKKADLRVTLGEFRHELLSGQGLTIGRLDGRFSTPTLDPLSQNAEFDSQVEAAINSALLTGFNFYAHNVLKYGQHQNYRIESEVHLLPGWHWSRGHLNPITHKMDATANTSDALAEALKYNTKLRVLVSEGYYDSGFYGMVYYVNHLPIPNDLQSHIKIDFYKSGHMIYIHEPALHALHDNTAKFIESTEDSNG